MLHGSIDKMVDRTFGSTGLTHGKGVAKVLDSEFTCRTKGRTTLANDII